MFLIWLVLNDGVSERIYDTDIDPMEEAGVISRALLPISLGESGYVGGKSSGYIVVGEIGGKSAHFRLLDNGALIADIAVCLHSRSSAGAWDKLKSHGANLEIEIDMPRSPPWCGVLCHAPEAALPPWFDSWTKTLAMALARRKGW